MDGTESEALIDYEIHRLNLLLEFSNIAHHRMYGRCHIFIFIYILYVPVLRIERGLSPPMV